MGCSQNKGVEVSTENTDQLDQTSLSIEPMEQASPVGIDKLPSPEDM